MAAEAPRGTWATAAGHAWAAISAMLMSPVRFVVWSRGWLQWWTGEPRRRLMLLVVAAAVVLCGVGSKVQRLDMRYLEAEMARAQDAESFFIPPPLALEAASLGHPSFVADMLFLRASMYFINHLFGDRLFEWLDTYVQTIVALDPDNPRVYEWASQGVKFGQLITNEALEKSNDYARAGIDRFPDHWRFYFDIGFNYFIEWKPEDEEERARMRDKAIPFFSIASGLPGTRLDPNFVAELYLQDNDVEMALFHAYQRYWESSEREREALRGRITRFESEAAAERLAGTEAEWRERYPYLGIGLYEQLGAPVEVSVPRSWADTSASGVIAEGERGAR